MNGALMMVIAEDLPDNGSLEVVEFVDRKNAIAFQDAAGSIGRRVGQNLVDDVTSAAGGFRAQDETGSLAAVNHNGDGFGAAETERWMNDGCVRELYSVKLQYIIINFKDIPCSSGNELFLAYLRCFVFFLDSIVL